MIAFGATHPRRAGADELPPQSAPTQISLTASNTSFVAGQSVTLTAATDFDVATSNSVIAIVNQTTNQTLRTCTTGTSCDTSARFFTGPAHTYVATVDALTSDPVTVTRAPWSITLAADKTTYTTGQSVTLTATANQDIGGTNNSYMIYIFDQTANQVVGYCQPDYADHSLTSAGETVCSRSTRFYSGGPHTYVAAVGQYHGAYDASAGTADDQQAASNPITAGRAGWAVSLVEDRSVFRAGDSVTLTATANQDIGSTNNSYVIYIFDQTANQVVGYCQPDYADHSVTAAGETVCSATTRFFTGGPHTYIAVVGQYRGAYDAAAGTADDQQAVSNTVTASREDWNVTLSSDKTVYAAGDSVTLTAVANQDIGGTNNSYAIYIFDQTANQLVGYCRPDYADHSVTAAGETVCSATTRFYSGGAHTYVAVVGQYRGGYNAAAGTADDQQATSNTVTAARKAWTISLAVNKTVFAAGDSVTLTAVANQDIGGTNNSYAIYIFDQTANQLVGYCRPDYSDHTISDGQTVCSATTRFYTGGPHTYIAVVGQYRGGYNAAAGTADDQQATSNTVTAARKAWTISLAVNKTVFAAGDSVTLTAVANQDIGGTNNSYAIYIFDQTANQLVGYCRPDYDDHSVVDGQTVCSTTTRFYTGGPHTYIAVVGQYRGGYNAAAGTADDQQATSNTVTAARKAWTISLAVDKTVFAAGDSVTLTAVANQDIGGTNNSYAIYFLDETGNQIIGQCQPDYDDHSVTAAGQTVCSTSTRFYSGGAHTYVAVVGQYRGNVNAAAGTIDDEQANSNEVYAQRAPWAVTMVEQEQYLDENTELVVLGAAANQDVGATNGSYHIFFLDYTHNTVVGSCDTGTSCVIQFGISRKADPVTYLAEVASWGSPTSDIQATSNGFTAPHGGGPTQLGESSGGSNPAEPNCQHCTGDPIDAATGEYTESLTDLAISGKGPGLQITRNYGSASAGTDGPFGYGWTFNDGIHLRFGAVTGGDPMPRTVTVVQENGATIQFNADAQHNYTAPARVRARLTYDQVSQQWSVVRKAVQTMVFDSGGRLLSLKDPSGNAVTLSYNANHQLTGVSAPGGRHLGLTWTGDHITEVADSAGRSVNYGYDSAGDLTSSTAADAGTTQYGYDGNHLLTTLTTPRGAITTNAYDGNHRVSAQTDPIGRTTTFSYTGSPQSSGTTTVTSPSGSVTVENYEQGELTSVSLAAGTPSAATWSYSYDAAGNQISVADPAGATSTSTFDGDGNRITSTDPIGHTVSTDYNAYDEPTAVTDALGHTSRLDYDSLGRLITSTTPSGHVSHFSYNADGTLHTATDAAGQVTTDTYTATGNLKTVTDPDDHIITYGYDSAGRRTTTTNNNGATTTVHYDSIGRVTSVVDPLGHTTSYSYDGDGHRTATTDANGNTTSSTLDLAGQVTSSTDALNNTTDYTYNGDGSLATLTDPLGNVTTYHYDARGDRTAMIDADNRTTSYLYDGDGRLLLTTTPAGAVTTSTYNAAGQVISMTDPNGHSGSMSYDAAGQLISSTDADQRTTGRTYNADGQLTKITLPDNHTIQYGYDVMGRETQYTNADGGVTVTQYDGAGLVTSVTQPGGLQTQVSYDAVGRASVITAPDGSTATRTYDADDQVNGVSYSVSGATADSYTYDNLGQVLSTTDATGTSSTQYDADGRVTQETNGAGATVGYQYDADDRLSTLTYPGGHSLGYGYDNAGQLISATDWSANTTSFGYDADGHLTSQQDPNGVSTSTTYQVGGEVSSIGINHGTSALASYGYTYDAADQVTGDTSSVTGVASATATHAYGYDPVGQLGAVSTGTASPDGYTATDAGLLTGLPGGIAQTYNAKQELTSTGSTTYSFDGNGSRTSSTSGSDTTSYSYTASGALSSVNLPGGASISYTSDASGLRQTRTKAGVTAHLTWAAAAPVPLLLDDGSHRYLYAVGTTPYAQIDDSTGAIEYLHADRIGSVRLITDASGAVVGTNTFDSYGKRIDHTESADSAFGFTGALTDPDTGLVYLRARDYDPATGQFLTVDPLVGTTHQPYAYVGNDPLTGTDPLGLCFVVCLSSVGQVLSDGVSALGDGISSGLSNLNDGVYNSLTHGFGAHVVSFIEGFGNAVTFGATTKFDNWVSPGSSCTYAHDGWYTAGDATGQVALAIATDGASSEEQIAADAARGAESLATHEAEATAEREASNAAMRLGETQKPLGRTREAAAEGTVAGRAGTAAEQCLNSFTADTPVTMADGTKKPIKDVKVGDRVLATDPETGETNAEPVVQLIRHSGQHAMVLISLADGSVLDSTDGHPIWDASQHAFVNARQLRVGDKIETADGALLTITGLTTYTADLTAYNLQIHQIHTYYAGATPVLVHNSCTPNPFRGTNMSDEDSLAYHYGKHGAGRSIDQYAQDAQAFADNPTGTTSSVNLDDGTTGTRYRTRGGPGGILDSNGNVVTFWYK